MPPKYIIIPLLAILLSACYYDNEEELFPAQANVTCEATMATFVTDVSPILVTYCTRCHRVGRTDGGVNLEGYDQVLPFVNNGSLLGSVKHEGGFNAMPPSGGMIPGCDIQKISLWIDAGAANN